ncbi:unnamed protein product [Protopolystoma xenopodis]|uniref:Uncharacterized protein n=1 Tax=Protopolystoma xenopodis TaxID=117903 RepID=A0A3S5A624_9PLAT|nr:unnamed protein product [Protopolystoma xenopodis]
MSVMLGSTGKMGSKLTNSFRLHFEREWVLQRQLEQTLVKMEAQQLMVGYPFRHDLVFLKEDTEMRSWPVYIEFMD